MSNSVRPYLWTVAHQAPLSMGFSRQEYWSGLPCLLQEIFPTQRPNLCLLHLLHCSRFFTAEPQGKPIQYSILTIVSHAFLRPPELTHLVTGSLYTLNSSIFPFLPDPNPLTVTSLLCQSSAFLDFTYIMRSNSVCLCLTYFTIIKPQVSSMLQIFASFHRIPFILLIVSFAIQKGMAESPFL